MPRRASKPARPHGRLSRPGSTTASTTTAGQPAEDIDPNTFSLSALTLDVPIVNRPPPTKPKPPPFRFLSLPPEIRLKIYEYHFVGISSTVDLEPENYTRIHKKLAFLRTCRTIYSEGSHFFWSSRTFRIFPTHGRFTKTKKPLLARLNPRQRSGILSLELRIGPGFNKPYRSWVVNTALGLKECINVRNLTVYVEVDPSDTVFNGFRKSDGFYETFSRNLLDNVLSDLPNVKVVTFDGHSYVKKSGDMMQGLLRIARMNRRMIGWGEVRGWTDEDEVVVEVPVGPTTNIVWGMSQQTTTTTTTAPPSSSVGGGTMPLLAWTPTVVV